MMSGVVLFRWPRRRRGRRSSVGPAHPVNEEHDLPGIGIDVVDHLLDYGADDALLQPRVCRRSGPDRSQILGQGCE